MDTPADLIPAFLRHDYLVWSRRLGDPAPRGDVDIRIRRIGVEK